MLKAMTLFGILAFVLGTSSMHIVQPFLRERKK
jgi:hypothetical protein